MEHHDKNASLAHEVRQKLRQWQDDNPDWKEFANAHPSQLRDERARRRRQQICEGLAGLTCSAIQRRANESRLPANMGHLEKLARSEVMTIGQHSQGIRIPLDHQLGELYEFLDNSIGNLGTDVIATAQNWVRTHIEQPSRHTLGLDERKRG